MHRYIIEASNPISLRSGDKLLFLRQLDREREWDSLDGEGFCLRCQTVFIGRQLDVTGGTRALGPLRRLCPTEDCRSAPQDWIYLRELRAAKPDLQPRVERNGHVVRVTHKRVVRSKLNEAELEQSPALAGMKKIMELLRTVRAT